MIGNHKPTTQDTPTSSKSSNNATDETHLGHQHQFIHNITIYTNLPIWPIKASSPKPQSSFSNLAAVCGSFPNLLTSSAVMAIVLGSSISSHIASESAFGKARPIEGFVGGKREPSICLMEVGIVRRSRIGAGRCQWNACMGLSLGRCAQ